MVEKGTKRGAVGTCNAYAVGPGAAAHGRTHFYSRILIKKKERLTTGMQQGAREEPAGITLLKPMPPGMLKKEKKEPERETGPGIMRGSNMPWSQGPANTRTNLVFTDAGSIRSL